jgi:hypothetical protein
MMVTQIICIADPDYIDQIGFADSFGFRIGLRDKDGNVVSFRDLDEAVVDKIVAAKEKYNQEVHAAARRIARRRIKMPGGGSPVAVTPMAGRAILDIPGGRNHDVRRAAIVHG